MSSRAIFTAVFLTCGALAMPQGGESEECRPKPPQHGQTREECCKIPMETARMDAFKVCREKLGMPHPHGPPPSDGNPPPKPIGPPPHECLEECVFNNMGYLTPDMQLNKEVISTKVIESFSAFPEWQPIVEEALRKCLAAAPGEIGADSTCRSGSSNLFKCYVRALHLNCPSNAKNDSETCNAEREKIERCPNMMPPPPLRRPSQ